MPIDKAEALEVLKVFGRAFNKADVDGILGCVTDDFEWRLADGPDAPDAKVLKGSDEVRAALESRGDKYKSIKFSETELFYADEQVIGRFRATGEYADGRPLDVRGIDIYDFRDGKIAVKDSYWKDITD
jgi:ketosteroid isomerase-like protein